MDQFKTKLTVSSQECPFPVLKEQFQEYCLILVVNALMKNNYNKAETARELGVHRTTLLEYLRRHRPSLINEKVPQEESNP